MAKNDIKIKINVDGKDIELTKKQADKLGKSLDKTGTSAHSADRRLKGAAQASSNTTKNFSKMAQGISGGLVPAYATLAANIFAISAAFNFLKDAANYRILIQGQQEYATITGESLKLLTSRLQEATGQQLAFAEAAQSVAIARAAGVTTDQIGRLGVLAKNASIALGRDLTDSLNRLIRGVTKAEPELLDELGIILRLEVAAEKYGRTIGKTKDELSIFEKSQAVVNEVLTQGEEKFGNFNTELNAFSKLAKSFDDLLNRIKMSLTGVAEFMAKGLSKNTVALAGSFALLGSSILKAITPEVPQINVGAASKTAQQDVSKFYTGSKAKAGRFKSGAFSLADLDSLESSVTRKKSTVVNFENMSRVEAQKTVAIMKAGYFQTEASQKAGLAKQYLNFKGTHQLMIAEYGKFIGTMKLMGRGLTKAVGALGWIGLLFSAIGIVSQLFEKFKDPAVVEFEETTLKTARALKEQNKEIGRLNNSLKTTATRLASVNQLANFFSNFSFAGAGDSFRPQDLQKAKFANFYEKAGERRNKLTGGQGTILRETITSLELQQSKLIETSDEYEKIAIRIAIMNQALEDSDSRIGISAISFKLAGDQLRDLSENGTEAQKVISKFSTTSAILTNSVSEMGKALSKLKKPETGLSVITKNIDNFGDAILSIGKLLKDNPFKDLNKEFKAEFDEGTLAAMEQFIGKKAVDTLLAAADAGDINLFTTIGQQIRDEAERLHKFEMRMLTEKTTLQTQYNTSVAGIPKILAEQMQKQQKVKLLESDIAIQKQYMNELTAKGSKATDAEIMQQNAKIKLMESELTLAQRLANETVAAKDQLVDTFATSMQSAINGLIQGTMTLKDAFKSMAQAVLQQLAQILAQMMAMRIMGSFFPGFGAFMGTPAREGGIMRSPGYRAYADGGVATGPNSGYPAMLHGTEAVVPLPNGRSIPVEMSGGAGGTNNVTINVDAAGNSSTTMDGEKGKALGIAIQAAVMETLQREQRPGGVLGGG